MTNVNLNSIFQSLESTAQELNESAETANKVLLDAERRLVSLNIGLEFWYLPPVLCKERTGDLGPNDTHTTNASVLGIARVGRRWCFAIKPVRLVSGFYEGDMGSPFQDTLDNGDPLPLLESSREGRIAAYSVLPEFLEKYNQFVRDSNHKVGLATSQLT